MNQKRTPTARRHPRFRTYGLSAVVTTGVILATAVGLAGPAWAGAPAAWFESWSATSTFGDQAVGSTSSPQTISFKNLANVPLYETSATASGNFVIDSNGCAIIPAFATCDMTVDFVPSQDGPQTGNLSVFEARSPISTFADFAQVALTGTGVEPAAPAVTSQPADQSVVTGQAATFTAQASGNPRPATAWQYSDDGGQTWNPFGGSNVPTLSVTAAVSENGDLFRAAFTNMAGFAYSNPATLTVRESAPTVSLSSHGSVDFGSVPVGAVSPSQQLTVTNSGTTPLHLSGYSILGNPGFSNPANTVVKASGSLVPASNSAAGAGSCTSGTLAPGDFCTISLEFRPPVAGYAVGSLTLVDDAADSPQTVILTGTGTTVTAPAFAGGTPSKAGVSEPYSYRLLTTGSPSPQVKISKGTLPPGLVLQPDGTLFGTPTVAGSYSFTVQASNGVGNAAVRTVSLIVRPLPVLSIAPASVKEPTAGVALMRFTISMSRGSTVPVSVSFTTKNGTALAGSDYLAAAGTVTIAAGQLTSSLDVSVLADSRTEPSETLSVRLAGPVAAKIGAAAATGTIL
jgi:Calx-beta domain/Putative Ig domain